MAQLTAEKRKHLAKAVFGLPAQKAYPMPDKAHARLALSGASHAYNVGNISASQKAHIDAMANRKLKGQP